MDNESSRNLSKEKPQAVNSGKPQSPKFGTNPQSQVAKFGSEMVGYVLGGCEIVEFVGKGGMGAVYRAIQLNLNREVALKILSTPNKDDKSIEWFQREAQSIAQLEHRNIIQVYALDYNDELGTFFIVMQYVDGASLDKLVKMMPEAKLPIEKALFYSIQIAEGLASAHHKGIIHRDIKPANIMVTVDEVVKITDFGLAKSLAMTTSSSASAGLIVGTPLYMAPEQCVGTQIDARTDIYSLGATLYYLLAGRPPFMGENSYDILEKQITEAPPALSQFTPEIPPELANIVCKMLAKNREDRYTDCDQLVKELGKFLQRPRTDNYRQEALLQEQNIFRMSGVNKPQLVEELAKIVNDGRKGILSIRSKDEHLFLYLADNTVYGYIEHHMDNFLEENSQLSFLEMITILLTISFSWEPFTWEFVQEDPPEGFEEYCIAAKIDVSSFFQNTLTSLQILLDIGKTGCLVLKTPIISALFSYEKEKLNIFSPIPSAGNKQEALDEEKAYAILEKILQGNYSLEYLPLLEQTMTSGLDNSLSDIFFQIVNGYPDFSFFQTFSLYNANIFPKMESKITLTKIKELETKVTRILQQIFQEYKKFEDVGLPRNYAMLFVGTVVKEKAWHAATKIGELALASFAEEEVNSAKQLLEVSLKLYRYNFKLLEELSVFYENTNNRIKAIEIWIRCGSLREELGEFEQAKSSYEYANSLDENNTQAMSKLFYLYIQTKQPVEKIIRIGEKLLPKLRKANEQKMVVKICTELLEYDPELLVCHQELVNYYLDSGNIQQAVEAYEKIANIYHRQENKIGCIQTYHKILKIFPERDDIREKLMALEGKSIKLVKALDTATKVIKKNKILFNPKYAIISIAVIFFGILLYREVIAYLHFQKIKQQVVVGNYLQVKSEIEKIQQNIYFSSIDSEALQIYNQEEMKIIDQKQKQEKVDLLTKIAKLENDYGEDYQKILSGLDKLYNEYYKQLQLESIIQNKIDNIRELYEAQSKKKDESSFASIEKLIEEKKFSQAYVVLDELRKKDFVLWNQKTIEKRKTIQEKEKRWQEEIVIYEERQQELLKEARSYEEKGNIEQAILIYENIEKILPDSTHAKRSINYRESLEQLLQDGEKWLQEAERLMTEGKYNEGVEYLERISVNTKLSGSRRIKNAKWPIFVTTEPSLGIECFYGETRIGSSPCVLSASNFTDKLEWNTKTKGLRQIKVEKKYTQNNKLYKVTIQLERVPLWSFSTKGRIESPLLLYKNTILCASRDNNIYGVNKNGERLWDIYTGRLSEITGPMQINNNKLFVSTLAGNLFVLNLENDFLDAKNAVSWSGQIPGSSFYGGAFSYSSGAFLASNNGYIYYSESSGNGLQVKQRAQVRDRLETTPVVQGKQLLISGKYIVYSLSLNLQKILWQSKKYKISGEIVTSEKNIFIPTSQGLVTLDSNGKELWKIGVSGGVTSPVISDGVVYFSSISGYVYTVEETSGKQIAKTKVATSLKIPLLKYQDVLFACSDYQIWAVSTKTNKILLKYDATNQDAIYAKPVCDGEYLYFCSGKSIYKIWIKDIFTE